MVRHVALLLVTVLAWEWGQWVYKQPNCGNSESEPTFWDVDFWDADQV